jgi:hypothetical protein
MPIVSMGGGMTETTETKGNDKWVYAAAGHPGDFGGYEKDCNGRACAKDCGHYPGTALP